MKKGGMKKINWKFFISTPADPSPATFFKIFNTWIPGSPEIFIDVVDYKHLSDGPLTLLVGHAVDYALDRTGGTSPRHGFLYAHKLSLDGKDPSPQSTLRDALRAAKRLADDPEWKGSLAFRTDELLFMVNDRGLAPNTPETFARLAPELNTIGERLYGKNRFTLTHLSDPAERFQVKIQATHSSEGNPTLEKWIASMS